MISAEERKVAGSEVNEKTSGEAEGDQRAISTWGYLKQVLVILGDRWGTEKRERHYLLPMLWKDGWPERI